MSLYEADLFGAGYDEPFARLEVDEAQRPSPRHTPVILHIPNAVVLNVSDDEAEVTLNLTATEARTLALRLTEAARAADGSQA